MGVVFEIADQAVLVVIVHVGYDAAFRRFLRGRISFCGHSR